MTNPNFDATEDGWCEAHRAAVEWYRMEVRFPLELGQRLDPVDIAVLSCGCEIKWPRVEWDESRSEDWDGKLHMIMIDPFTERVVLRWWEPEGDYE
jgi:hypothetical protein